MLDRHHENTIAHLKELSQDPALIRRRGDIRLRSELKRIGRTSLEECTPEEKEEVLDLSYYHPPKYDEDDIAADNSPSKLSNNKRSLGKPKW